MVNFGKINYKFFYCHLSNFTIFLRSITKFYYYLVNFTIYSVFFFIKWLERIIIGWIKLIYSSSGQYTAPANLSSLITNPVNMKQGIGAKFDQNLINYKKQLSHFMYSHYAHIRIKRLFDIVIDFPDSKSAVDDLKICLEKTNLRTHVIKSLKSSIEQRLLHPGKQFPKVTICQFISFGP